MNKVEKLPRRKWDIEEWQVSNMQKVAELVKRNWKLGEFHEGWKRKNESICMKSGG